MENVTKTTVNSLQDLMPDPAQDQKNLQKQTQITEATKEVDPAVLEQEVTKETAKDQIINKAVSEVSRQKQNEDALIAEADTNRQEAVAARSSLEKSYKDSLELRDYYNSINDTETAANFDAMIQDYESQLKAFPDFSTDPTEKAAADQQAEEIANYNQQVALKRDVEMDLLSSHQASMQAQQFQRKKLSDQLNSAYEDMQVIQKEAEVNTVNQIWQNKSFSNKMLAALAIAAGSISKQYGGSNEALKMIQDSINQEVDAQNQTFRNKLAIKASMIDKVKAQLQVLDSQTSSDFRKLRYDQMQQQLDLQKTKYTNELLQQIQQEKALQALSSGQLTKEQSTALINKMPKRVQERAVRLPDGSVRLADNKQVATDLRKYEAETLPAAKQLQDLLDEVKDPNYSRLSIPDRRRLNQKRGLLAGQLRLAIVGPGALSDTEYQIILNSIGDPNKFIFQKAELDKVDYLMKSLKNRINLRYKQAGIDVPVMQQGKMIQGASAEKVNQAMVRTLISNEKAKGNKLSKEAAESHLKEKNLWAE